MSWHPDRAMTHAASAPEPTTSELLHKPLAWLPIVLCLASLALIVGYVAGNGNVREPGGDEGAAARLFQVFMGVAAITALAFALRWLPVATRAAGRILLLQLVVAGIPLVLLRYLE